MFIGALGRDRTFMVYDRSNRPALPQTSPASHLPRSNFITQAILPRHLVRHATPLRRWSGAFAHATQHPRAKGLRSSSSGNSGRRTAWHQGGLVRLARRQREAGRRRSSGLVTFLAGNANQTRQHSVTELGKVANVTGARMSKDVRALTELLVRAGHQVAWLNRFLGSSLIIADPTSKDAWARVEALVPFAAPSQRPSVVIRKADNSDAFVVIVKSFEQMWKIAEAQK